MSEEDIIKAIRWKLGLPVESDSRQASEDWHRLARDPKSAEMIQRVGRSIAGLLVPAIDARLDLLAHQQTKQRDATFYQDVWNLFLAWIGDDPTRLSPILSGRIRQALAPPTSMAKTPVRPVAVGSPRSLPPTSAVPPRIPIVPPPARPSPPPPTARPSLPPLQVPPARAEIRFIEGAPPVANSPVPDDPTPAPAPRAEPAPLWKYLPIPDGPDPHVESWAEALDAPGGWKLLGARVRGKKHKHEGTNGDDWFEFRVAGPWSIIAVADGAGSKKYSRVGAKASCLAAARHLVWQLEDYRLRPRDHWDESTFARNPDDPTFIEPDLAHLQKAMVGAVRAGYEAIQAAVAERTADPGLGHEAILGRPLEVNDLSCTLLLAIHATVPGDGAERSLVMACQVGDGMTGAVTADGGLVVLGEADSGEYSGETDFLTSRGKLAEDNLLRKLFVAFQPIRALMVMTDGVADDYFPNDPGLLRLFGDLALNGVVAIPAPADGATLAEVDPAWFSTEPETPTAEGPRKGRIRSIAAYAEAVGKPWVELVRAPERLAAGASAEGAASPQERLRDWLDLYQVRGSFDDRTLVILHRSEGA